MSNEKRWLGFIAWLANNPDLIDVIAGAAYVHLGDIQEDLSFTELDAWMALKSFLPPINYAIREPQADDLLKD